MAMTVYVVDTKHRQQPQKAPEMQISQYARNPLGRPAVANRDWSFNLLAPGLKNCLFAAFCPCVIYGKNKQRLEHLIAHDHPDTPGDGFNGDCGCYSYACLWVGMGAPCMLHAAYRSTMRARYHIKGSAWNDCGTTFFCGPCALVQEQREIEGEEQFRLAPASLPEYA